MKKTVLFIQGAGEGAHREDRKLADNLQQLLGPTYEVRFPKMQNEEDASYDTWVSQIKEELNTMSEPALIAGHSVGGSILIKFLAEEKLTKSIAGIFLIAAPYWGKDGGWTYDGYETLMLPKESDGKLSNGIPIFLYHSDDDETVPFTHVSLFAKRFPRATVRKISGRGHQFNNDLHDVATDIKNL